MNVETKVRTDQATIEVPLAPNNLPAVAEPAKQERKPRLPKVVGPPAIYSGKIAGAILKITREIGRIQKDGKNTFQNYKYTRWEDINEKLSPLLVDNGLIITQNEISRDVIERSAEGCVLAIVYHFTVINEGGEAWPPVEWTAIARLTDKKGTPDDKAASKCHTQAEKGFCIKQFKIRTDDYGDEAQETMSRVNPRAKEIYREMEAEIDACDSAVSLGVWGKENAERASTLHPDWQKELRVRWKDRMEVFKKDDVEWTEEGVIDPKTGEVVD